MDLSKFNLSDYSKSLPNEDKVKYCQTLSSLGIATCPYEIHSNFWTRSPSDLKDILPTISTEDIGDYVYHQKGVDGERRANVKTLESYKKFKDGLLVSSVGLKLSSGVLLVKGEVLHSMAMKHTPLKCWVAIDVDGTVFYGHCDCKAGLVKSCSHVGTLLFGLVALSWESCTSSLQQWNKRNAKYLNLPSTMSALKTASRGSRGVPHVDVISDEKFFQLLQDMGNYNGGCALHALIPPFNQEKIPQLIKTPLPPRMSLLFDPELLGSPLSRIQELCEPLIHRYYLTQEQRLVTEKLTRKQHKVKLWSDLKEGRISASLVFQVTRTKLDSPSKSLLQKIVHPFQAQFHSAPTDWGIKNEGVAVRRLEKYLLTENLHAGFQLRECGLVVSTDHPFLAASPDRVMFCPCHGEVMIEVKCPYKHRSSTIASAARMDKQFCLEENDDGLFTLKQNHPYYYQVQLQISLLINEIIPKCSLFVHNVILPELVSHYWSAKRYAQDSIDDQFVEIEVLQSSEAVIPSHSSHDVEQSLSPQSVSFPDVNQFDDPSNSKENTSPKSTLCIDIVRLATAKHGFVLCHCNGLAQIPLNDILIKCANKDCHAQFYHSYCLKLLGKKRFSSKWICDACKKLVKKKPLRDINC